MNLFCKTFAVTSALLGVMAGPASATSVGAGGSVSVFWNLDFATDIDGNYVDGTDAVTFAGLSSLTTTSRVTTENGIASDTQTTVFSFTNTSTDIYINWSAGLEAFTSASAYSSSTQFGDYYFDSNSFVTVGNASSFSSTNGGLTCSNNNPNSPNFNCFGYAQGFGDSSSDYVYGICGAAASIRCPAWFCSASSGCGAKTRLSPHGGLRTIGLNFAAEVMFYHIRG
jgi:hypothetical protein